MKLASVVIGLLSITFLYVAVQHSNSFDVVKGCRQYNADIDYNGPVRYFPTSQLIDAVDTDTSKLFRFGVLGPSGAVLRYGPYPNPYRRDVIEIVLEEWDTELTIGRLQRRLLPSGVVNKDLAIEYTPHLLSPFRPVMFVLQVSQNGRVDVFLEGQRNPLVTFFDPTLTPATFMAFTKYQTDLIFFFDCPMKDPRAFGLRMLGNNTTAEA